MPSASNREQPLTGNPRVLRWVEETARLTKPDRIVWCDGSEAENTRFLEEAVARKLLEPLDPGKLPGCYLARSDPSDVARVEHLTFICTPTAEEAGPTNHWMAPQEAYRKLGALLDGSMRGRTLYVVPYLMGPAGSPLAKVGIELTDSLYVVLNMRIMTRMGRIALDQLGETSDAFNRGVHGMLDLSPERRFICHFPQDDTVWSVGSNYGGNVLLGKKCLALRIGSYLARREGWLAEHMLILGAQSPAGETTYVAAAFPSSCGKTNFAMLIPPPRFAGWKIWTVGDDIAWMRVGDDGRLWAVNPENGYFGVAPGTSTRSNPNAMKSIAHSTLYTNVARTPDGDVWWEEKTATAPAHLIDWRGQPWTPASGDKAAHPNARFTAPMTNNPSLSPRVNDPSGVPISAVVFGGRRGSTVPLVLESFNWTHGVYLGATLGSETTAAATGKVGVIRRDPMAMLPFCGYHMGDYFGHWLEMQQKITQPPRIFLVNWFRKDSAGRFLWPGYGENMRVLQWMVERAKGNANARETALGYVPGTSDLDLVGLDVPVERVEEAVAVRRAEWMTELESAGAFLQTLQPRLPKALELQRQLLLAQL